MSAAGTVVLSCAGVGSRLGLGKTKVLMELNGESLLAMHMRNFAEVEDLRIVVGFQAEAVIRETLKYRKDVTFVHNRDYFDTSTGYSLWLGARHASEYVVAWDGDLVVHPDDVQLCLESDAEYLGYSEPKTEDAVMCSVDNGMVTGFRACHDSGATEHGFEWTGPCLIKKSRIYENNGHVFNIIENYLPMRGIKIRGIDIDTYSDYQKASQLLREWRK